MFVKSMRKCFCLLFVLILSACDENLVQDIDELKANKIIVALAEKNITANKKLNGSKWTVVVDKKDLSSSLQVIEHSRLFVKERDESKQSSRGLIQSREERAHYLEVDLAKDIEGTLERIPGILEARVHLNIEERDPLKLNLKESKSTASALIIKEERFKIDEKKVSQILSGASGISEESISVVFANSEMGNLEPKIEKVEVAKKHVEPEKDEELNFSLKGKESLDFDYIKSLIGFSPLAAVLLVGAILIKDKEHSQKIQNPESVSELTLDYQPLDPRE